MADSRRLAAIPSTMPTDRTARKQGQHATERSRENLLRLRSEGNADEQLTAWSEWNSCEANS
jgi:hypothetical protein